MEEIIDFTGGKIVPWLAYIFTIGPLTCLILFAIREKIRNKKKGQALKRLRRIKKIAEKRRKRERKAQTSTSLLVRMIKIGVRKMAPKKD